MQRSPSVEPTKPSAARAESGNAGMKWQNVHQAAMRHSLRLLLLHLPDAGGRSLPVRQMRNRSAAKMGIGHAGMRMPMVFLLPVLSLREGVAALHQVINLPVVQLLQEVIVMHVGGFLHGQVIRAATLQKDPQDLSKIQIPPAGLHVYFLGRGED